jgi:two-component system KDP operon response regulator KdpE
MRQKPFILLVEDDAPLRRVIAANLDKRGYFVLESATFRQALDSLSIAPQMIILDIGLPDATGWEVAEWAKTLDVSAPIIVISASEPDRRQMARFSPLTFLHKPFGIRELVDLIETYLPAA